MSTTGSLPRGTVLENSYISTNITPGLPIHRTADSEAWVCGPACYPVPASRCQRPSPAYHGSVGGQCRGAHRGPRPLRPAPRVIAMWGSESGVRSPRRWLDGVAPHLPPTAPLMLSSHPASPSLRLRHCAPAPCASERGGPGAHAAGRKTWWGQMAAGQEGERAKPPQRRPLGAVTPNRLLRVLRFRLRGLRVCGVTPQSPSL
jgi:hypothetical protein